MVIQSPRVLRVSSVAKICGVSARTVRGWAESGLLRGHKRGPKLWFFVDEDVTNL
jgi:DNA-binding transcriptional MerR regulator